MDGQSQLPSVLVSVGVRNHSAEGRIPTENLSSSARLMLPGCRVVITMSSIQPGRTRRAGVCSPIAPYYLLVVLRHKIRSPG